MRMLILFLTLSGSAFAQTSLEITTPWYSAINAYARKNRSVETLRAIAEGLHPDHYRYSMISESTDRIRWSKTQDPEVVRALRDGVLKSYPGESVGDLSETRVPMIHILSDIPTQESVEALWDIEKQSLDSQMRAFARRTRRELLDRHAELRAPRWRESFARMCGIKLSGN